MPLNHFLRDQRGAVMVEVTIMLSLTLVLVLGAMHRAPTRKTHRP